MKFEGLIVQEFDMEHQWGLCVVFRHECGERIRHAVRFDVGASGLEVAQTLRSMADWLEQKEK